MPRRALHHLWVLFSSNATPSTGLNPRGGLARGRALFSPKDEPAQVRDHPRPSAVEALLELDNPTGLVSTRVLALVEGIEMFDGDG